MKLNPILKIIRALIVLAVAHTGIWALAAEGQRPNVVFLIADDLGYADIGVQGNKDIPTPNIDGLARGGLRFTSGYVSGPYCSPTRAGLLTGRYQQRFGHEFNPGRTGANGEAIGLSLKETTIGDRFKALGYRTGLVGKWHQGFSAEYNPVNRGFDEHFGFLSAARSYTNSPAARASDPIRRGLEVVEEEEFLTDAFAREAVGFIDRHQKEPFLLYLGFNAVHSPLDVHPRYWDRFAGISDPKRRRFATLLAALDDAIGSVVNKIKTAGLEENTLIVFISDNGGPTSDNTSRNNPLRGFKATTWEGGIRVPFIISWKGHLPAGKVEDRPIIQLDLLPTALAAAGVEAKPEWKLDGVNLLPYLTGRNRARPHEDLYWRFGQQIAIRKGDWKLVKAVSTGQRALAVTNYSPAAKANTDGAELYNLAKDISESHNLATKEPEKVKELAAAWNAWNRELADPAWGPGNLQRRPARVSGSNTSTNGLWKSGDVLSGDEAPEVAERPLTITADVDTAGTNGVILAQGASAHGYAIYLRGGKLAFGVRIAGELTVIEAGEPLSRGSHRIEAQLAKGGKLTLAVDGRQVAKGKAPGLIVGQPADGLTVGEDGNAAVGEYEAPNPFAGKVSNVHVQVF
jgi:arylsulfatase A-like enzyme